MIDLSLYIYDIAQNAVRAGARRISIAIWRTGFIMVDDGCGMDARTLSCACKPGFTTRDDGRGGRGLYLLLQNAETLDITSEKDAGTKVYARFRDDFPMGDIPKTKKLLQHCNPDILWNISVYQTKEELRDENS